MTGSLQADRRYEITRAWWEHFLGSLKSYLETGKGTPGSVAFSFKKGGTTTSAIIEGRLIAVAPEHVWAALTNPAEIGHWWTNDLNAKPEVGSLAEFRFGEWGDFVLRFEVAELDQGKRMRWMTRQGPPSGPGPASPGTLSCSKAGQNWFSPMRGLSRSMKRMKTRGNWRYFLDSLKSYLETGKGTPGLQMRQ